jgi:N6-adenosine-specific RNA methylase IME4
MVTNDFSSLIGNNYKIILADPPWKYRNVRTGGSMRSGAAQKYSTMTLDEIKQTPVKDITDKNCCLFLWATVPMIFEAGEVMKEWGFTYKTALFWRKIMSLGMGYWFRGQVEICLFGIKGKVKAFRCQRANIIQTKVGKHSEKPTEVYELIEGIAQTYNLNPKVELFARIPRNGWDAWGDEL